MNLFLIRHGETEWNALGKIQGSCDIGLNETGIAQAREISEKISGSNLQFVRIYSSGQQRAVLTAQIVSGATGVDHFQIDGLQEIHFGEWEGLSWKEVQKRHPEAFDNWLRDRRYSTAHKGESYQALVDRVLAALRGIISENNADVLVVTHGAVIMSLLCYLDQAPFEDMMKYSVKNAELIRIDSARLVQDPLG